MAKVNPIQLQKNLKGAKYPAKKADLVKRAEENGANDDMRALIGRLPDREFENPAEVNKAIKELE
jgi:hypothetical protein